MFRRGKLTFLSSKDDRIKIINERINLTEKHFMEMCTSFAMCSRKMAKLRNANDELANKAKNYAEEEKLNGSLSEGLDASANVFTIQSDYMDILIHRMEVKIVNELAQFEHLCKTTRDSLRNATMTRDKAVLKQQQLLELKSKFSMNNSAADPELLKAKLEVNRCNQEIDDIINTFEKQKLSTLKAMLTDYVLMSIKHHTKALEALTASYYNISNIDENSDFLEFQKALKTKTKSESRERKQTTKNVLRSQSMDSLDHDQLLSPRKRHGKLTRSNKSLMSHTDDEQVADDDDDDDEEEEDEDKEEHDEESEDNTNDEDENSGTASEMDESLEAAPNNVIGVKSVKSGSQIKHPFKAVPSARQITRIQGRSNEKSN